MRASGSTCLHYSEFDGFFKHDHPDVVRENLPEIEEFSKVSAFYELLRQHALTSWIVVAQRSARSAARAIGDSARTSRGLLHESAQVRAKERGASSDFTTCMGCPADHIVAGSSALHEVQQVHTRGELEDRQVVG